MLALGTIVNAPAQPWGDSEFHSGLLDFYDHWSEVDPRLAPHHEWLSPPAEAFAHDLVDLATYTHEILGWLEPARIQEPASVVVVGGMAQAFVVSIRSACDAIAQALAHVASSNPGQVPATSLRALSTWARENPKRVHLEVAQLLGDDLEWFWNLRSIRDHLVHGGCRANIHCDGRQFNLWVHSPQQGWVIRAPLVPLLRDYLVGAVRLADKTAAVITTRLGIPDDRRGSRVVSGVRVAALHKLLSVADDYAQPSP